MSVVVFKSDSQCLLIPTVGLVDAGDGVYVTLAWLIFGISVKIFKKYGD